jgi:hypothetical protein
MRKLILAASILACAAPAAAQSYPDRSYPDPRDEAIVRALPHPGQIEDVADTVGRVAEAIMDVPVGPIADAVDPYRRGRHRDETLGDIANRDDPHARERIRDGIGAATVGASAIIGELAILTPVLRRSLEDASRRMEDAMRGRGRDGDRRYEREYERDRARDDYRR